MICYAAQGLRDWRSAQKIDPDKPLDDHHIYPRAYVTSAPTLDIEQGEAIQLVDCVVNRTLIPKNLNITVGKRPPQSYLSELKRLNSNLDPSLQDHLVPAEIMTDPNWNREFRKFLDLRSRMIFGHIERYVLEPAKEMEARYAASHEPSEPSDSSSGGRLGGDSGLQSQHSYDRSLKFCKSLEGVLPCSKSWSGLRFW